HATRAAHMAGNCRVGDVFCQGVPQSVTVQCQATGGDANVDFMARLLPLRANGLGNLIEFLGGNHSPIHSARRDCRRPASSLPTSSPSYTITGATLHDPRHRADNSDAFLSVVVSPHSTPSDFSACATSAAAPL